jgi:Chlorophyllase
MVMRVAALVALLTSSSALATAVSSPSAPRTLYSFKGDPFTADEGPLKVGRRVIFPSFDRYMTEMHFPETPGNYPSLFFVGGIGGEIPAIFYSELLRRIASYGVVVLGFNLEDPFDKTDDFFRELTYLRKELDTRTADYLPEGVWADVYDHSMFACHSGGCYTEAAILRSNASVVQGAIFFDPVGYVWSDETAVSFPILFEGSQFGASFPLPCASAGMSFHTFYKHWSSPKIVMNVTGAGHCDWIDDYLVPECSIFCKSGDVKIWPFKRWASGQAVAMMGSAVLDNCDMVKYLLDPSSMPTAVTHVTHDFSSKKHNNKCFQA